MNTWLTKSGYQSGELANFITDLQELENTLGLVAVGVAADAKECLSLEQIRIPAMTPPGRAQLEQVQLRVYTQDNYINRWNKFFGWPVQMKHPVAEDNTTNNKDSKDPTGVLLMQLGRLKASQRKSAAGIGIDVSFLSKLIHGTKPWPEKWLAKAEAWVTEEIARKEATAPASTPLIAGINNSRSTLDIALAYLKRGWSVVPQLSGAKQPCIKWKPFQTRLPTEAELRQWFEKWTDAGLAVVLGPVSGLFVIDVDGTEARDALVEHLGIEPVAPKVISGSGKPDRFHLFFRCPKVLTRAKMTPWHDQLEFRGQGGIVVIPPSLHKSGKRYAWAAGQSIDDLPLPPVPAAVLEALKPAKQIPVAGGVQIDPLRDDIDASLTTRKFLTGAFSEGPNWNGRLFQAACDLHGRGMPIEEAEPLLLAGAHPWNAEEENKARQTIRSAYSQDRQPSLY